jgi:hypothetical protein
MTRPEFFALEAGEHLERIALLAKKPVPEKDALRRQARMLRAAALTAGPPGYAVAAGAIEDIARRYEDGTIRWTPWLAGRLAAAIAQCQHLLRRVREWSVQEIDLCRRIAEALQLEDPGEEVVPIETLAPDRGPVVRFTPPTPEADEIVPIESLLYAEEDEIVPIGALLYSEDGDIVPIESLLLVTEPEVVAIETLAPAYNALEQTFATLFRLIHGKPTEAAPVPIEQLLYRGRRALERAAALRKELASERTTAGALTIDALLDELLDLVPLALEHE